MNLVEAKYLEYTINIFKKALEYKGNDNLPTYKILWKHNDKLLFANTLNIDDNYNILINKLSPDFNPYHDKLPIVENGKFPIDIMESIHQKYFPSGFSNPINLYNNSLALFKEAISVVKSVDTFHLDNPEYRLLNVSYLDSKTTLPFILIDENFELEPVSLIEVSKN
jgi:hypothetical protein